MITAKMWRTWHSSYSITRDRGALEVADSGGPPARGRWAGGASPPLLTADSQVWLLLYGTSPQSCLTVCYTPLMALSDGRVVMTAMSALQAAATAASVNLTKD